VDQGICSIQKHKKLILQRYGWMISASLRVADMVFGSLVLPTADHGGPIDIETAHELSDPIIPFVMVIPI
jgi:hypothetical protein